MSEFDAIRPYDDSEVKRVVDRLLGDNEFLDTIAKLKLPKIGRFIAPAFRAMVRSRLSKEVANVNAVEDFQALIEDYLKNVLDRTVDKLSISGLSNLDRSRAHLFISNHRDIAMDPAFVNWTLYQNGFTTLRIAIGDNLLTKPFASDLMRLNKSFIVNRSATAPREKLKAAKLLSKYIQHSVVNDNENVWIAQREGRAKDGIDSTNPAIISMLTINKNKQEKFEDYIESLQIVPVSISYEYDPCDKAKARELYEKMTEGEYTKGEHEDVESIAQGIVGYKGRVHLSFGRPLANFSDIEGVTEELNKQIRKNYVLQLTNCFAYETLEKTSPRIAVGENGDMFHELNVDEERQKFKAHVQTCDAKHRDTLLKIYANPVYEKLAVL
ncbi:1-acyl-sn-glycerol-3-phosphate acyltransferase [Agarilytica rhodophyticola]|uniref:1-acyl-sn-glycerol-3-phosphate acyltransferase n=1 Tax=Agarilytica rhodophyticola TaxID=1737490 RepID=UPI000B341F2A|nr:1-acyl-sn-glycerol-3-phosphate acyltransferase [Agarilytica rhodophyticola]